MPTYEKLIAYAGQLDEWNDSTYTGEETPRRSQLPNRISTLRAFLRHHGLEESDSIGPELYDNGRGIESYVGVLGVQPSTKSGYRAHLRWWVETHQRLLRTQNLPDNLREAVALVIQRERERLDATYKDLAELSGIQRRTLMRWGNQEFVPSDYGALTKLERFATLAPGTFTSRIHRVRKSGNFCHPSRFDERVNTPHLRRAVKLLLPHNFQVLPRERQDELLRQATERVMTDNVLQRRLQNTLRYSLGLDPDNFGDDVPETLREEIRELVAFKTDTVVLDLRRPDSARWRSKESQRNALAVLGSFLGWYVLPSEQQARAKALIGDSPTREERMQLGYGGRLEDLTLALTAVPELVRPWVDWRSNVRSLAENSGVKQLWIQIASLNHPVHGFLIQHPHILDRLPDLYRRRLSPKYLTHLEALAMREGPTAALLERELAHRKVA